MLPALSNSFPNSWTSRMTASACCHNAALHPESAMPAKSATAMTIIYSKLKAWCRIFNYIFVILVYIALAVGVPRYTERSPLKRRFVPWPDWYALQSDAPSMIIARNIQIPDQHCSHLLSSLGHVQRVGPFTGAFSDIVEFQSPRLGAGFIMTVHSRPPCNLQARAQRCCMTKAWFSAIISASDMLAVAAI